MDAQFEPIQTALRLSLIYKAIQDEMHVLQSAPRPTLDYGDALEDARGELGCVLRSLEYAAKCAQRAEGLR